MSLNPCPCCEDDYEETVDSYCEICGEDVCESCLEGHVCVHCREEHHRKYLEHEEWLKRNSHY